MLIKTYRLRLYVLYLIPFVLMIGLVVRLYYVQVVNRDFYEKYANSQHFKTYSIIPMRGKIYDSEGHELAGSIVLDDAFLNLNQLPEDEEKRSALIPKIAASLQPILNDPAMGMDELVRRLKGRVNRHPFIGRDISEEKKHALQTALLPLVPEGITPNFIDFQPKNKRRYSRGQLAPHVVGYTAWSEKAKAAVGVEGVERTYEEELRGKEEEYVARKTATGKPMEPADPELLESTFGHSIKLTINESIQAVTQNVLEQGVNKAYADAGVAVCYAVKTGEILSMASYPAFNLNNLNKSPEQSVNRAVSHAIEPGSVMKIITFASLFSDKKIEPFDTIYCEWKNWRMPNGRLIRDSHSMGMATVAEVFQYSSNIGTIKAARAFDDASFYDHLVKFGFGKRTGIDLPAESPGVLAHYRDWSGLSMSSLPMGYEIQMTAVQVVAAVGAIANKGNYMQPHVVKEILDHNGDTVKKIEPKFLRSVIDPAASRKVLDLMELVVEKGTAKPAKLEGYRVGGKTGTTKKVVGKEYGNSYIASFCGVAPIEDPEVCIYVYIDNPRGSSYYGGAVAAPVFREIAREAMKVLRVPQLRPKMPAEEFKKTLEMVRNKIEGRVPIEMVNEVATIESGEASPGVVPQLKNLTLAEAVKRATEAGLMVNPIGSGTVVSQDPPANETIEGERVVNIVLENTSNVISRQLQEVVEIMGMESVDTMSSSPQVAMPATSVPLSLRLDGREIALPIAGSSGTGLESGNQRSRVSAENVQAGEALESAPVLDLEGDGDNESQYDKFRKQYDQIEEQRQKERQREPREIGHESGAVRSTRPSTGPVPELDGTDEIDPTRETLVPLDITTPDAQARQEAGESVESSPARGVSLYNL